MALGELTGYSWQHIGAIERGQVAPSEDLITACDRALAAGGQLVAMFPAVVREQASIRHRREAARREGTVREETDVDWARLTAAAHRPSAISMAVVEDLEQITDRQRMLYHELSSAEMLVLVEAHLSLLASLLRGSQPEPVRHRIASAAVEAAGFAAWLWFDLGDQFKMDALYEMTASLLQEAGNPALGCYVAGYRALAADATGLNRYAVDYTQEALGQSLRACSTLARSWLSAIGANVLAARGDGGLALELLGQARSQLDTSSGKEDWMYDFDYSALAGYRGQCHLRLGQPREAIEAFTAGLAEIPDGCERRAAFLATGLAGAYLMGSELDTALAYANRALAVFARCGSVAGLRRVQAFRGQLLDAGYRREAESLDEQARAHLAALT
jgi:tetratricopeptide (TPR) repeat protein